jgi:tetrahydromethanopterin S-methyltransferase subunit G
MSAVPTPAVVADRVERLTKRIEDLEHKVDASMTLQRWQMAGFVGAGSVLTLLLPKISAVLGLT